MRFRSVVIYTIVSILLLIIGLLFFLFRSTPAEKITYGASFNARYALELGLAPEETFEAILSDVGVRHVRLAAHWDMIEPSQDTFYFGMLDREFALAEAYGADIILSVGRRLPRWPECHTPSWAKKLSWEEQKEELRAYIRAVVEHYKDRDVLITWQIENEPFLELFAYAECGNLDVAFLDEEIALVRELDGTRPILITDSGNLGTWYGAWRRGNIFGTSVYVYLWNEKVGPLRTLLPPRWYQFKRNVMSILFGEKETLLIELSAEPWLLTPISETPIETQLSRMNIQKFEEILAYAKETGLEKQYLWGAEWWYWLHTQGKSEFWERARILFREE